MLVAYGFYPAYVQGQEKTTLQNTIQSKFGSDVNTAMNPILDITVYQSATNHTVLHRFVDKNDLITNIFIKFMETYMTPSSGAKTFTATDTGGVSRTFTEYTGGICSGGAVAICNASVGNVGSTIQMGTGNCAAARTDTAICTPYQTPTTVGQPGYSSSTGNVTITSAITALTPASITESGLIMNWMDDGSTVRSILFFHDTFVGIPVIMGNVVVVQYTLELNNTGFTNAFGYFLTLMFMSVSETSGEVINPYGFINDTTGSPIQPAAFYSGCSTNGCESSLRGSVAYPYIQIGSGSTALTRTAYALATSACSTNVLQTPSTISTSTLLLQAGIACGSSTNISEADLVMEMICVSQSCAGGAAPIFMYWRGIFTTVPVGAGASIGVSWNMVFN